MVEITREKFKQFEKVKKSGLMKMAIVGIVMANSDLTKQEVLCIMNDGRKFEKMYGTDIVVPDINIP